jgi:hypothetical protein
MFRQVVTPLPMHAFDVREAIEELAMTVPK